MLIDLISTSNYNSYNIKIANMFGLKEAVYLNEAINIYEKAIRKNKTDNCYFMIDREYFKSRTTLSTEEQTDIESKLSEIGILSKNKDGEILLDLILLTNIMSSDDEDLNSGLQKLIELKGKKPKKSKAEKISDSLKASVNTGNSVLDDFIKDWIDSVIAKQGWMTKTAVIDCQEKISQFAFPNVEKAVDVLKIASLNGWRDVSWAINKYKETHRGEKYLTNYGQSVNISTDVTFK